MIRRFLFYFFILFPFFSFGQFGPAQILTSCTVCSSKLPVYADFDGDELEDIIFVNYSYEEDNEGELVWLKHQVDHSFSQEPISIGKMKAIRAYYVKDYEGDGDLDVIVRTPRELLWFENLGANRFSEAKKIITNRSFTGIQVIDFDSDGDIDFLLPRTGGIIFFENEGLEEELQAVSISAPIKDLLDVSIIDINKDGYLDVLTARDNVDRILYFENNGQDSLIQDTIVMDDYFSGYKEIYQADFNKDGFIDLLVISADYRAQIGLLINNGSNEFLEKKTIGKIDNLKTTKFADLNGDGYLDVLTILEGKTYWYESDGQGNFSSLQLLDFNHLPFDNLELADINKDGHIDFLTAYSSSNKLVSYENDGQTNFTERVVIQSEITQPGPLYTADLDADGDTDILTTSYIDNTVFWYQNTGQGQFSNPIVLSTNSKGATQVIAADLDNDAALDVVTISDLDGKIAWFRNEGGGQFSAEIIITDSLYGGESIFASDLDGDGDKDLLFKDYNAIGWYENVNKGEMIFRTYVSHIGFNTPQRVFTNTIKTTDIDKDGDEDIFMERTKNGDIYWFENDGTGTFERKNFYNSLTSLPGDFSFGDINKDGNQDFAAIVKGNLNWYTSLEDDRIFRVKNIERDVEGASAVVTVDLEGDGDLDILMTKYIYREGGTIVWYENLGEDIFLDAKEIYKQVRPLSKFVMDDINGDGSMDIVFTTTKADGIAWIQNFFAYPVISGISFWDKNANGIFEETEELLNNIPIQIAPLAASTYTDQQGAFNFYVANGTYTITAKPDSCWSFSTDSAYVFTIERDVANHINFGFQLQNQLKQSNISILSAPTRCGFKVPFRLLVENDGCQAIKGQYGLVLSPLVTLIDVELEPSEIHGDTLLWDYEELIASDIQDLRLTFEIAGTEFIGEIIHLQGLSYIVEETGEVILESTYDYQSEIRCAYDPNDKLVSPNRLSTYDQNYTLFEEALEYVIRFQNTGNDTAFNVVIRDTLDNKLDWSTFQPIIGSHTFETLLNDNNGSLAFSFKDILLPDSTTNEQLSHGFITYKISPKKGLSENTIIENTANIYFDFNPPIITNTTRNVMVSQLPQTTLVPNFSVESSIKVYPNPFERSLTIENRSLSTSSILTIFDATGRVLKKVNLQGETQQISVNSFSKGLYFYQIINEEGQPLANGKLLKQ